MRQWVLSFPKRLRYFLHQDAKLVQSVLRIFLHEEEEALRSCSPDVPDGARFGAVTFVHRFGSALNANLHVHCCVIDGVFRAAEEGARVQQQTRRRVLSLLQRHELLSPESAETMPNWEHGGGFSLNAEARVPS